MSPPIRHTRRPPPFPPRFRTCESAKYWVKRRSVGEGGQRTNGSSVATALYRRHNFSLGLTGGRGIGLLNGHRAIPPVVACSQLSTLDSERDESMNSG